MNSNIARYLLDVVLLRTSHAWGDYYGYENTLMVHIRRIREKIEDNPSNPEYLMTIRGLGYKLIVKEV